MSEESRLDLPAGQTHVRLDGEPTWPAMVLIHGATVPHWQFDFLAEPLIRRGWRLVRFDLLGHGRSERPKTGYSLGLFVRQTRQLLEALGLATAPVVLLGHSMGAAVAAAVAGQLALRPGGLILSAPMLDFSVKNRYAWIMRKAIVGELFTHSVVRIGLSRRRKRRYRAIGRPDLYRRFRHQTRQPGFWSMVLSLERDGVLGDQSQAYRTAARVAAEPLILRGDQDELCSDEDVRLIARSFSSPTVQTLSGLGHNLLMSAPEAIVEVVLDHLAGWD